MPGERLPLSRAFADGNALPVYAARCYLARQVGSCGFEWAMPLPVKVLIMSGGAAFADAAARDIELNYSVGNQQ